MSEAGRGGAVRPRQDLRMALSDHAPFLPVTVPAEVAGAIQALKRGDALPHQQQIALKWIVETSENGGALYFPGENGRRDTDYALGRSYMGRMITTILTIKLRRENG